MDWTIALGIIAGAITTASFLPQVLKTWKTKSAKDISLGMFVFISVGMFLWIVYGFLINSFPVIAANIVSLTLALIVIVLKLKYK